MEIREIKIRVTPEATCFYELASKQMLLKLDALLTLKLSEAAKGHAR